MQEIVESDAAHDRVGNNVMQSSNFIDGVRGELVPLQSLSISITA